jgi:CRISPR-associated endonuclease/helicase Cas3
VPGSAWLPLWRHLADSADVAARLWDTWVSTAVTSRIAGELPGGAADGRLLVRWLAGIHDLGKATPAFATKVPDLWERMRARGFTADDRVKADLRLAPHSTAGYLLLVDWLHRRYGWERWQAEAVAVVVGGHHGMPPSDVDIDQVQSRPYLLGTDGLWPEVRDELLDWITRRIGVADRLPHWRQVELSQPVQALLTALVIVADWIASNEELFPYAARPDQVTGDVAAQSHRIEWAWQELDLPTPWRAVSATPDIPQRFAVRFGFPDGTVPYPVQLVAAETAYQMPLPGLLVVEAPMGDGKTEAALVAAEIIAGRAGTGGVFVALPTRATSDAMFARVLGWLSRLPDEDVGRGARDALLMHGKARLNTEYSQLYRDAMPSAIGIDEGGVDVAVHRWLAGRKRGMLSSFAIGTIDQLLFAALKSRHVVLRHLGLAGKVVIIDEAHAYDVYMSRYLERALHWLGAYGVPVIVLSATLPAGRRADMMAAYDSGRLPAPKPRASWRTRAGDDTPDPYRTIRTDQRYPLLTVSGAGREPSAVTCASSGRDSEVWLHTHADDEAALAQTLRAELAGGGCALVICNTVTRVRQTAETLRAALGSTVPVTIAHSRFMGPDRVAKDQWLRDTFGPPDRVAASGRTRPTCHVVVASQVAEQSLDIDFDLLVTDLAPVDLLLQRVGRLHRHARADRPEALRTRRCLVRGADWTTEPPTPVAGSVRVYGQSALLRGAGVLWPHLDQDRPVRIPDHVSPLVQAAYGEAPVGPESWQSDLAEADAQAEKRRHDQRDRADAFRLGEIRAGASLVGWLSGSAGDAEGGTRDARGRAQVRDGAGNLEVLVLVRRDGRYVTPPWLPVGGGVVVPTDFPPSREQARTIASCVLPLPASMTVGAGMDAVIAALELRNPFPAWQNDPWLGGELILDLDPAGRVEVAGFAIKYDSEDGLTVTRLAHGSDG